MFDVLMFWLTVTVVLLPIAFLGAGIITICINDQHEKATGERWWFERKFTKFTDVITDGFMPVVNTVWIIFTMVFLTVCFAFSMRDHVTFLHSFVDTCEIISNPVGAFVIGIVSMCIMNKMVYIYFLVKHKLGSLKK